MKTVRTFLRRVSDGGAWGVGGMGKTVRTFLEWKVLRRWVFISQKG